MLRRSCSLFAPITSASLAKSYCDVQNVWSLDFKNQPLTTELKTAMQLPNGQANPMFHILNEHGEVVDGCAVDVDALAPKELCQRMIKSMIMQNAMDEVLLNSQRQGRISFYMTGFQEEAAVVGSAAAFNDDDYLFTQYREAAAFTYRGYSIAERIAQCMGNIEDPAKGRQMPMHYGSVKYHCQTVSSPLGTKLPHAAGAGYAFRLEKKDRLCVCYFGEGAASEGDFHAGFNFAATRNSATLFFCRNNGYAISTPTHDQYRGDGILLRGVAYGIPSYRVDGHDALAVLHATRTARAAVFEGKGTPAFIEAMTYRAGHHSTSDDSSAYRSVEEISQMHKLFDPILRFQKFMERKGWWSQKETDELIAETQNECLAQLNRQEHLPPWAAQELFTDTTAVPSNRLKEQQKETMAHCRRHKEEYGHLVEFD